MTPGSLPQANENGTAAVSENERPKLATEFSGAELVAEFLSPLLWDHILLTGEYHWKV